MEIETICPQCGTENVISAFSVQEHLDSTKSELENGFNSGNLKSVIHEFEGIENKQLCFPVQLPIECENEDCGCDYDIRESANWNEIKRYFLN